MPSSTRGVLGAFSLALLCACNADKTITTPTTAPPRDSSAATFPPFVGPIAFTSTRDGSPYLYVAAGDGSPARRLAKGQYPAWSSDGRSIAFNDLAADGSVPALHVMNWDGSDDRVLPLNGIEPVWSPDDAKLMFRTPLGIYAANVDGSGLTRLVSNDFPNAGDVAIDPAWSPDGTRIAFVAGSSVDTPQIYIANADGTKPRRLLSGASIASQSRPRWSPDGFALAFEAGGTIMTVAADGSNLRTRAIVDGASVGDPDWSQDGNRLLFTRDSGAESGARIFVRDTVGTATHQLIPDAAAAASPNYRDYQAAWTRPRSPWDY